MLYFRRYFYEPRIEKNENWGSSIYYLESNEDGEIIRQIEVYENGKKLKYSEEFIGDEFGFLSDQKIDLIEFKDFTITKKDFDEQWKG
ncbi:hypothetical protein [Flavobacterium humidisoli]|uniref:Uncharacterized protein n=1 Tax=Flavobacterium humidisoli TaxID=2937442 RepID=A0ABY4LTN8_9FLAO|nr:hypothetical protein [Flavobacterium humidisoli]UPZ16445.1 hypothetical protein M0M44_03685 [Flavobacterium humidisoli]